MSHLVTDAPTSRSPSRLSLRLRCVVDHPQSRSRTVGSSQCPRVTVKVSDETDIPPYLKAPMYPSGRPTTTSLTDFYNTDSDPPYCISLSILTVLNVLIQPTLSSFLVLTKDPILFPYSFFFLLRIQTPNESLFPFHSYHYIHTRDVCTYVPRPTLSPSRTWTILPSSPSEPSDILRTSSMQDTLYKT